jgi:hypothetical protein
MTLPLVFEPSAFGREVARLGVIVIGEVAPYHGGPRIQAYARIFLPDVTVRALPAPSIEKARWDGVPGQSPDRIIRFVVRVIDGSAAA